MAKLTTDELNILDNKTSKMRSIPYEKYFGEMDLDEEEKEKRILLAKTLEQVFLFLFVVLGIEKALKNEVDKEYYYQMVERRYKDALETVGIKVEEYVELTEHITEISKDIVDVTLEDKQSKEANLYLTSDDRAMLIAENESNGVRNCVLLTEAIKKGFKKKTWVTKHDKKVRHSHILADGVTIGIYDNFHIGSSLMKYPKDDSLDADPREIVNCRCVLKFKK